ncbi:MAG: DNA/RNA nuclease SfsA [Candidatus Zipacnadales bacterium]
MHPLYSRCLLRPVVEQTTFRATESMNLPQPLEQGAFVQRLNRFTAEVRLGRDMVRAHLANSGRLQELLVPEAEVYLHSAPHERRKTTHELLLVRHRNTLVSIDSRVPAIIAKEALLTCGLSPLGIADHVWQEMRFGWGRVDLRVQAGNEDWLVEVKGCTLVRERIAIFPDAPTERGRRHVANLTAYVQQGGKAMVLFVIQREDADELRCNWITDPSFATLLQQAATAGVVVRAYTCHVTTQHILLAAAVPVQLQSWRS